MTTELSTQERIGYEQGMSDKRTKQLMEIWLGSIRLFFRLQAMGREIGAVTAGNAGNWGLLQSLIANGPTTVPELARMRPVSRQHIQTMANEMAEEGLIEFRENPRHKRSKLVAITDKGAEIYRNQGKAMEAEGATLIGDLSLEDLETAARVIETLRAALEERQSQND